ncbi:LysR family transcriptional regulator [Sagittula sp. SSi028]|uniref:LysR family transcriptional regulator n=1 Tax=Sagittula sp. SSi028 TaxID=3400636 RepID=UPI003AF5DAEA
MLHATWLETFTTLAEEGHFTRAAAKLNMTQPGVSQHLRKLENQVGRPLIAQDGKRFALTEAGEAVRDLGLRRRREEYNLLDQLSEDRPDKGCVRIACSGSFATLILPRLIEVMKDAPQLVIHVEAAPRGSVQQGVLDGSYDIGILQDDPGHPRLVAQHIAREELCLILPTGLRNQSVDFAMLQELGQVAHPDGAAYADDLMGANFPEEYTGADRLRQRFFVNQINQIPAPVAAGAGYAILPRSGIAAFVDRDKLWSPQLPQRRFHDLWCIARKTRPQTARFARVEAILMQAASELEQMAC